MPSWNDIGLHCLRAFSASVATSVGVFYRIDAQLEACDFRLYGMPLPMHQAYLHRYRRCDPLQPRHCLGTGREVVPLKLGQTCQSTRHNLSYRGFLQQHDIIDVTEILAWSGTRPVAGLSLLRHTRLGTFSSHEVRALHALQGLMQLAVSNMPTGVGQTTSVPDARLTPRERQIADHLRDGLSNKELARVLGIGLPTVKTHLIHLYRKLDVDNRTQLVKALYLEQESP